MAGPRLEREQQLTDLSVAVEEVAKGDVPAAGASDQRRPRKLPHPRGKAPAVSANAGAPDSVKTKRQGRVQGTNVIQAIARVGA